FALVLNTKKEELTKLKHQVESYEHEHTNRVNGHDHSDDEIVRLGHQSETDDERSNDAFANLRARSRSPMHTTTTTTLNDGDSKRLKYAMSDTDTSGDEDQYMEDEVHEIQIPIRSGTQSQTNVDRNQDNMLDLGDDHMDYKRSTISKHHQRRKYVTGVNSISTRSYLNHSGAGIPPTLTTPSLPEESQTTDELSIRMSDTPETYACPVCTFVQSIKRPTCELCENANPHFSDESYQVDEALAKAIEDPPKDEKVVECAHCHYINIGHHIRTCGGCKNSPYKMNVDFMQLLRNFNMNLLAGINDDSADNESTGEEADDNDRDSGMASGALGPVEKGINDDELQPYFNRYILLMKDQQKKQQTLKVENLHQYIIELFNSLEYKNNQSKGQLTFTTCQICLDENLPMVTMKSCGHCVLCADDFNQYLRSRIHAGDILPWIPCPAESCSVPCHADNIVRDAQLTYSDLLIFLTEFMFKKLCRNPNFITCTNCQKGGFIQLGPPKKETVTCQICNKQQTIEKGSGGDLDTGFQQMIQSGQIRECPTCRHLTLKEKGLCNIIECAKCGIWWNWNTREQGHNGSDLKQRARINGTLWEPGELRYQRDLERNNPEEFKALLERNDKMYSITKQPEQCVECNESNAKDGWFICQECQRIFCNQHCIIHRHEQLRVEPTERYNRHVHFDQIAEWERKAIDRIRKQADEARRPLIAPPTPISQTLPSSALVNEHSSGPFSRFLSTSSTFDKQSPVIDQFELLSDETLDDIIGDIPSTSPSNERSLSGHVSFASQYPYMTGVHRLRLSIDQFQSPSSWAFVGIMSEGIPMESTDKFRRTSFGWHLGRQSIVYNRQSVTDYTYDGRDIRSSDILGIVIDCNNNQIDMKNERTLKSHQIRIDSQSCPFPWFFVVNFNYGNKDSMHLLQ
ncbi:unnamed protein product, partial [Adineta ricciae]